MDDEEKLKKTSNEEASKKSNSNFNFFKLDKFDFNLNNLKKYFPILIPFILIILIIFSYNKLRPQYDYLIVGSGLYGATFNYLAKKSGKKTLVIERRNTTGGNLYCENIEGIFVHKYGPHIFHTDNKKVWDFVNSLVDFYPFQNQPVTKAGLYIYSLPFNMWTYNQIWGAIWPQDAKAIIEEQKFKGQVHNLEQQALSLVGKDIYEKFIKGYTEKQWGRVCPNLPPFIIKRLPIRFIFNNNYFNDRYQGIPEGCFNALIDKLLADTKVITDVDFNKNREKYRYIADKIVYTGKIDEYFNYAYGKLQYRTVRWENEIIEVDNYQGTALINYADRDVPYTRVIEHKHLDPFNEEIQKKKLTVVSFEYNEEWDETKESYYPVNDEKNNQIYQRYKELADSEQNVIFGGRLAQYKYFDMKDIIEDVFKYFDL